MKKILITLLTFTPVLASAQLGPVIKPVVEQTAGKILEQGPIAQRDTPHGATTG